jgi:hypothetical protein
MAVLPAVRTCITVLSASARKPAFRAEIEYRSLRVLEAVRFSLRCWMPFECLPREPGTLVEAEGGTTKAALLEVTTRGSNKEDR